VTAFHRPFLPGCAEKSYGIQVARLAGLPENVTDRAKEVLQQLEAGHQPAESVKEVPTATSVPAKTRKKQRRDDDGGRWCCLVKLILAPSTIISR